MTDEHIRRGRWLLDNIKHAAMATVNSDNTPHNTPYLFMKSDDLKELYWGSNLISLHSQNIERTGEAFIVLYEANAGGGLYIKCQHAQIAAGVELGRALSVHNKVRAKYGKEPLPKSYYQEPSEQRMYIADTIEFWVNYAERDENGLILEDKRVSVSREQLLEQ